MAREALEISKSRLASATLVLELGAPVPVLIRPADCVTAIVNLLFNAIDATEGKGNDHGSNRDVWRERMD